MTGLRKPSLWLTIAAIAAHHGALPAGAQDPTTSVENPTVERERIEALQASAQPGRLGAALLSGGTDIVLLEKVEILSLHLDGSYTFTTNARLVDENSDSDHLFRAGATLRAATKVDQRFDIYAETRLVGTFFADNTDLDTVRVAPGLGAGTELLEEVRADISYNADIVFDRDLSDRRITLHNFTLNLSHPTQLAARTLIVPLVGVMRTFADPSEFDSWEARAGATLAHVFPSRLVLQLAAIGYGRFYDDFFEVPLMLDESREDYGASLSAELQWRPRRNVVLAGGVGYNFNDSNIEPLSYDAFTARPRLRLSLHF